VRTFVSKLMGSLITAAIVAWEFHRWGRQRSSRSRWAAKEVAPCAGLSLKPKHFNYVYDR
jgi:hypothetical protein